MGFWNYKLYGNDTACDVRDAYIEFAQNGDISNAYKLLKKEFSDVFGSDEEPLFWYALAETQWQYGELSEEVKQNALNWINQKGGLELFEGSKKVDAWLSTLASLQEKLISPYPQKTKKHILPKPYVTNPWNTGDYYAYLFHTRDAQLKGLNGKYIVFKKIGDAYGYKSVIHSVIEVYEKLFDHVPHIDELSSVRILPLREAYKSDGTPVEMENSARWLKARMITANSRSYSKKWFTFIGSTPINTTNESVLSSNETRDCFWEPDSLENFLIYFLRIWEYIDQKQYEQILKTNF